MVFVYRLTATDEGALPTLMVEVTVFVDPSITDMLFETLFAT